MVSDSRNGIHDGIAGIAARSLRFIELEAGNLLKMEIDRKDFSVMFHGEGRNNEVHEGDSDSFPA